MNKKNKRYSFYSRRGKRFLDIIISFLALVLLSPVFLTVGLMVRIFLGSPVIFTQKRPGKDGKIFLMYKFRTMSDVRDEEGQLLPDDKRLTAFGAVLRKTSLDEIPELFNVLRGDMSLIGPRPLLEKYLSLYSEEQFRRHDVLPGITGLAQVNGRNSISWYQKFAYDVEYVDHLSFSLDVKILASTFIKVFKKEGISSGSSVTMEEFCGNQKISGLDEQIIAENVH